MADDGRRPPLLHRHHVAPSPKSPLSTTFTLARQNLLPALPTPRLFYAEHPLLAPLCQIAARRIRGIERRAAVRADEVPLTERGHLFHRLPHLLPNLVHGYASMGRENRTAFWDCDQGY